MTNSMASLTETQMDPASEEAQVKVTLTTTDEDIQLPESKRTLIVPASKLILMFHYGCLPRLT